MKVKPSTMPMPDASAQLVSLVQQALATTLEVNDTGTHVMLLGLGACHTLQLAKGLKDIV